MSGREKDRPPDDTDPPDLELEELPPLDDGDVEPPSLDDLGDLVGTSDGDDDGAIGACDSSLEAFDGELDAFEDPAAPDEAEGAGEIASGEAFDEEDEGWAEGGEAAAPLDDAWFDDDLDAEAIDDDGGAEGPIEDPDGALGEDEEGNEAQYLGPVRGRVSSVAFVDGALLAAGDGLYRVGADGLLHRFDAEVEIDAVSVCTAGAAVFLGTERRGLMRTEGFGGAVEPGGTWFDARCSSERALPGPLALFALRLEEGVVLAALTARGELLASDDGGGTWRGPLTRRRCLAAAAWEAEASILALVEDADGPVLVSTCARGGTQRACAGRPIDAARRASKISLAAAGSLIAVGSDLPGAPLRVSMDRGESFSDAAAVAGVTALATDAREPGWIAAATWDPGAGVGAIRVSRDGGKAWRTAFTTGRAEEREEPVYRPGRVTFLKALGDDVRLLVAATGEGVYSAPLPAGTAEH